VIGWGRNNYGQCDIPEGLVAVQVAGGGWHSLAIADTLPPAASFTATPLAGTAPLAVQFTDTSTEDPTAWAWDFGDGETSTQQNPQHTYAEPGTYTVTLTATNAYGEDTATQTDLITVYEPGPYYVRTYADLCKVGTGADGWTLDADYIQTADIQCPEGAEQVSFQPIGNLSAPFSGTYDGGGYTIRDLYIYAPEDGLVGLFGDVEDGTGISFTNITLENISITADGGIGGLIGWLAGETADPIIITNCNISGNIECNPGSGATCYEIGGLAGSMWDATVTNCHADVSISGHLLSNVGGLIGEVGDCTVTACSASGNIQLADEFGGGLIGHGYYGLILNDCHATGDVIGNQESLELNGAIGGLVGYFADGSITNCSATGTVVGGWYGTGGLVGDMNNPYHFAEIVSVSGCYATGNVSGLRHTGGLIGEAGLAENYGIENCYATGNVASLAGRDPDDGSPDGSAGGLIGRWDQEYGAYLRNCYSTGTVTAPNLAAPAPYAGHGGLIGMIYSDNGKVCTNCFWDTETSGQATSAGGATGKTTAEMQTLATFADWSIATPADYTDEVWFLVEGEDYPRLAWEGLPTPEEPTPTATSGTLPGPLPVRFVVQTYTGQALDNITVTATPLESTGPWSWLYDLFGISGDADLNGTALAGTTDTGGGIVFSLIQTVKYRVTVTDASRGINTSITLYPQEDAVVISVWPQEPAGSAGDFTLYAEEEAAGTRVGVRYATADLVRVTFTVTTEARGVVYTAVSVAQGDDLSYLLDGEPGEVFLYGYVAELNTGEVVRQDQFIRFAPESRPWIDLAPWIPLAAYHWASVFILVGFAMTFVRGEIRGALLTIPILSGVLWLIGWFQVPWLLVGAVLVIGVLVYMRMGESDLGF